eukprot:TRINITY_DN29230_c0_g1_i1.p1 TRINITY_DN29230_c0_g1~~TRINITY_DN29230_c0_g1_i1.p1  ORF type:complete len:192 (+),score=39.76 TRINITY_DN29230_c0_g1_i1:404-979(+)
MNRVTSKQSQTESAKEATLATTRREGSNAPIVVLDDDDDISISSPRSFAQARGAASNRNEPIPVANETDLELRLGPIGMATANISHQRHGRAPSNMTIVLCDDSQDSNEKVPKKRKDVQQWNSDTHAEDSKEIKLICAICMNNMEEETSTICGHIFCKSCITSAIQIQKKCPTCRRKLTRSNIHRIYLSSA